MLYPSLRMHRLATALCAIMCILVPIDPLRVAEFLSTVANVLDQVGPWACEVGAVSPAPHRSPRLHADRREK